MTIVELRLAAEDVRAVKKTLKASGIKCDAYTIRAVLNVYVYHLNEKLAECDKPVTLIAKGEPHDHIQTT